MTIIVIIKIIVIFFIKKEKELVYNSLNRADIEVDPTQNCWTFEKAMGGVYYIDII